MKIYGVGVAKARSCRRPRGGWVRGGTIPLSVEVRSGEGAVTWNHVTKVGRALSLLVGGALAAAAPAPLSPTLTLLAPTTSTLWDWDRRNSVPWG